MKRILTVLAEAAICAAVIALLLAAGYGRMIFFEGLFPEIFK